MAGSLKWFKYESDNGDTFGVFMDESNGEAVGNDDFVTGDYLVVRYAIPRNLEPRYALYRSQDGRQTARIVLTDPAASVANLPAQITLFNGVNANLVRVVGEVIAPIPIHLDTGLNDGDIT